MLLEQEILQLLMLNIPYFQKKKVVRMFVQYYFQAASEKWPWWASILSDIRKRLYCIYKRSMRCHISGDMQWVVHLCLKISPSRQLGFLGILASTTDTPRPDMNSKHAGTQTERERKFVMNVMKISTIIVKKAQMSLCSMKYMSVSSASNEKPEHWLV